MISFMKDRPPLVVFFMCLVCTAITLLYFSFYIKNTDSVPDSDTSYDWNQLLNYLKELNICISDNKEYAKPNNLSNGMVTIGTSVSMNLLEFNNISEVLDVLTLDGWHATCKKNTAKPDNLEISFKLPKIVKNITEVTVCVSLTGPADYLPPFSEPNCEVASNKLQKVGYLTSVSKAEYTEYFCQNGKKTKIDFIPQVNDTITNVLRNNELSRIYIHLLWTSFILIFVVLGIAIYGVFQSDNKLDRYIDKCKNLINKR